MEGTGLKSRLKKILFLILAVLPTAIVAVMVVPIWLFGEEQHNWNSTVWPVVLLQIIAIGSYWMHAESNKRLAPGELGEWVLQFIVYIPFGMLSYWNHYVWNEAGGDE